MNQLTPAKDNANEALSEDMTRTVNILAGIPERFYEGQRVITAKEAAEILQLTPRAIRLAHCKEGFLQDGVDYFEVSGEELGKLNFLSSEDDTKIKHASMVRLYTREGFGQLCNYSRTATAMKIRSIALRILFRKSKERSIEEIVSGYSDYLSLHDSNYLTHHNWMNEIHYAQNVKHGEFFECNKEVYELICSLAGDADKFLFFYTYLSLGFTKQQAGKKAGIRAKQYNTIIEIMKAKKIKVFDLDPYKILLLANSINTKKSLDVQRIMRRKCREVEIW